MADHRKRFERWRAKLPEHTRYLADQVMARIVPTFEAQGFKWYDDFAGGDPKRVAHHEIPMQRREGERWPTVQIQFDKRARPAFTINFAMLPPICRDALGIEGDAKDIQRIDAIVNCSPAYFMLCRGKYKSLDGEFGHAFSHVNVFLFLPMLIAGLIGRDISHTIKDVRFMISPRRFLDSEVDAALALLPELLDLFDHGIPEAWLTQEFGYVDKHVMLLDSWHLAEQRRKKAQRGSA